MRRMLAISAAFKALGLFKHLRIKVIIIKSQLNHKCRYSNKSCDNVFDFGHHISHSKNKHKDWKVELAST